MHSAALLPFGLAQVSGEVATMREGTRRQLKKAAEKVLLFLGLMALMMVPGSSQTVPALPAAKATPGHKRVVLVSIADRKLALLEDGKVVKVYRVAVGAEVSPSPSGEFQIVNRVTNPTYYHPHVVIPASKESPIGTRWVGLNRNGYGIHGTNEPRSIGRAASHGCIRMSNRDIAQFFELVRIGDLVEIHAERDADTARVFGSEPATMAASAAAQPAVGQ
ncbi:MAG TPA: L,D-transpeptidase [Terriglobales bacterium]|nr:L,D-transpeptidase [Terriglobales bacterium]